MEIGRGLEIRAEATVTVYFYTGKGCVGTDQSMISGTTQVILRKLMGDKILVLRGRRMMELVLSPNQSYQFDSECSAWLDTDLY